MHNVEKSEVSFLKKNIHVIQLLFKGNSAAILK